MVRKCLKSQFCKTKQKQKSPWNQTHLEVHPCIKLAFKSLRIFIHPNLLRYRKQQHRRVCRQKKKGTINSIRQRLQEWGGEDWKGPQRELRVGLETLSYLLQVFAAERLWRSRRTLRCFSSVPGQAEEWVWGSGSCPLLSCTGRSSRTGRCVWTLPWPRRRCFCPLSQQDCSVTGDQTDWSRSPPIASPHCSVSIQHSVDPDWSRMSVWSPLAPDWLVVRWHQWWAWLNGHLAL